MQKRALLNIVVAVLITTIFAVNIAWAEWKPRRPINIIVPYKAGGGTDAFARALSASTKGILKVPIVIVNKPGSSGIAGATAAASARPDGSTMMMTSAGSFLLTSMLRNTKVNPFDNFRIVAQVGNLSTALMVPKNSPLQSVQDLVDAAKAKPGKLRWAHTGRGGFHHTAGQGFLNSNDLQAKDIPFKGGSAARAALIGEQVDFGFIGVQQAAGFEEQLRVLGLNAPERDKVMSEVPTFAEQGFESIQVSSPIIVFAPNKVNDEIVMGMESILQKITATDKFAELMRAGGNAPAFLDGAAAEARLRAMQEQAAPIIDSLK